MLSGNTCIFCKRNRHTYIARWYDLRLEFTIQAYKHRLCVEWIHVNYVLTVWTKAYGALHCFTVAGCTTRTKLNNVRYSTAAEGTTRERVDTVYDALEYWSLMWVIWPTREPQLWGPRRKNQQLGTWTYMSGLQKGQCLQLFGKYIIK